MTSRRRWYHLTGTYSKIAIKNRRLSFQRKEATVEEGSWKKQKFFLSPRMAPGSKRIQDVSRLNREKHVLKILPNDNTVSSEGNLKLIASNVDPVEVKLALRRRWDISEWGVLIFADSFADLEKLVAEVDRSDLVKDCSVSKPDKRNLRLLSLASKQISQGTK